MFICYMLLEIFIFTLNWRFYSRTDEASILLLILHFLLQISKFCKLIDDDSCNNISKQDIKEGPMNGIWEKSTIVTSLSFSGWCLPYDSLSVKRINASDNGSAMRLYVSNIHVYWLVLVKHFHIVVNTEEPKDEGKSNSKQTNHSEFTPC